MMKFKTLYIDPPWPEIGGGKIKRGADAHYDLMTLKEIAALPVKQLADDNCHLYLWTTNNYLPAAIEIMQKWGFDYKTLTTWGKYNNGTIQIGLGQYYRGATEHCLFGVRGVLPYRTRPDGKRAQGKTLILAPRREHSRKPDEMRAMIESVSYAPRIELFARLNYPGWITFGDQLDSDVKLINGEWIVPNHGEVAAKIKASMTEPVDTTKSGESRQSETFRAESDFEGDSPSPHENPSRYAEPPDTILNQSEMFK